jgi:RNA polymerase sigma factor (sigma-70 family)
LEVENSPVALPSDADAEIALMQSGYRYALSLAHDKHDAEDLIQDAWLNLSRRYGVVGSQPLLFTTIRNLFVDRCRRKKIIAFESLEETGDAPATIPELPPGTAGDVETLLSGLQPAEREVIYLHYIAGHTAEEIGSLTQRPRGTVLSLLHRTLKRLQQSLLPSVPPRPSAPTIK